MSAMYLKLSAITYDMAAAHGYGAHPRLTSPDHMVLPGVFINVRSLVLYPGRLHFLLPMRTFDVPVELLRGPDDLVRYDDQTFQWCVLEHRAGTRLSTYAGQHHPDTYSVFSKVLKPGTDRPYRPDEFRGIGGDELVASELMEAHPGELDRVLRTHSIRADNPPPEWRDYGDDLAAPFPVRPVPAVTEAPPSSGSTWTVPNSYFDFGSYRRYSAEPYGTSRPRLTVVDGTVFKIKMVEKRPHDAPGLPVYSASVHLVGDVTYESLVPLLVGGSFFCPLNTSRYSAFNVPASLAQYIWEVDPLSFGPASVPHTSPTTTTIISCLSAAHTSGWPSCTPERLRSLNNE